ncbi:MAG: hypothetical protein A2736_01590 [Candidatus Yanofskybacteria bacterium RIFCSPHIGHO2_01_FULL_41_27]|uniref:EamA domain-containing protein n=4 Tax=Parcubacteria group TaxID=1794811 RepID=A0A1F8HV41_9BACT|nr:MAG: hypothetical protein UU84_C0014G0016 [Candidatus Yanofskybacteria bacterium GW2011_GWC2_41_9]KKU04213.1 MAG: hypothetical protein UX06_C0025G0004 [Candidatus Giovannonibacteria bacterium GW2011_GWA2_45_21]OGN00032.1 MAG: hypothetical protein A2736_01590 [Candidatus Yanofskybacteria bacterium RIFCSPHIGHO2_01_FULL_41_27]OGN09987.1 MAG: hypothetical protein A3C64_01425 [Candidatus Yanofskybacteria bacterium RIFCSPHIGHO2_02_FULL_41_12]OGN21335.1 MAG: hypothetical protein A3B00_02210 [Candid
MKNYAALVCGVLIWAVINGFVVKGIQIPPAILGSLMSLVGVALFIPWLAIKKPSLSWRQKKILIFLGLAAAFNNSFFYTALTINQKGTQVLLIHYFASLLAMVWVALIPVFKEKLDAGSILGVVMGAAGLVIATGSGWLEHAVWFYLAFLSAFFYSFEIVLSRLLSDKENVHPNVSAFAKLFFQLMLMPLVGVFLLQQNFAIAHDKISYILVAGFLLFLSFIFVFYGLKKVPAKHFAVIGYLDRVGAIAIFGFVWGERFGWNVWLGGALILLAEVPIIFSSRKK